MENESLRIKVGNRKLNELDRFKYLGSVLTVIVQGKSVILFGIDSPSKNEEKWTEKIFKK